MFSLIGDDMGKLFWNFIVNFSFENYFENLIALLLSIKC